MRRIGVYILLLAGLLSALSCITNPVTGKKEIMLVSRGQEKEIGKATDKQVIQQFGLYPDQQLQQYVSRIGKEIVPVTHRPELGYEFKVVDSPAVNAFAVPGGYVYFTRQIMAYFNNEAQFAGVMAHEIGHITARHSAQLITRSQLAQLGLGIASILSEDFRNYSDLAGVGVQLLFLKFSRDDERQADSLGAEYATKVGYDTGELADFFQTLKRLNPGNTGGLPGWFSTHPPPGERIDSVESATQEWQEKVPESQFSVKRDPYLDKIDGIVFGANPRHGFVEDGRFYHPDFKFMFPVPARWKVVNSAAQVQMVPESQDAAILLILAQEPSPSDAATEFVRRSKAKVLERDSIRTNGMRTERLHTEVVTEQYRLRVLSYFIEKDGRIFVMHGYTPVERFNNYRRTFQHTMNNFDHLHNRRILNVQPDRLRIRQADVSGSLRRVLKSLGTPDDDLEKIALLNGMKLDESISRGKQIKTVDRN
ncbi:MAG: M48 family metalloprotease [Candidatus Aminicenantes bacterium]